MDTEDLILDQQSYSETLDTYGSWSISSCLWFRVLIPCCLYRFRCTFHVQDADARNVMTTQRLINDLLSRIHFGGEIQVDSRDVHVSHIGTARLSSICIRFADLH